MSKMVNDWYLLIIMVPAFIFVLITFTSLFVIGDTPESLINGPIGILFFIYVISALVLEQFVFRRKKSEK